jgi:hypothetical protein
VSRMRITKGKLAVAELAGAAFLAWVPMSGTAVAASGSTTGGTQVSAGATTTGANVDLGRQMAASYGWTGPQFNCLNWLWTRESGWNADAANPTSDARGIPQNINGWSAYAPGQPGPQIAWGLSYIQGRYGTPCTAWAHEEAANWY